MSGDNAPVTPAAPTPSEPPKPAPPSTHANDPAKQFTQEDLERIAAKEKAQGKRSALKEFAEAHGFTSIEDAQAFIEAARQAQQAALTEEERRRQELEQREQALAEREAAAIARERAAARRSVLVSLGATGDDLDDAAALLRVSDDADDQAVQEAATALKERRPELFGARPAAPASQLPPAPGGAPAGAPPSRTKPGKDDAKARAHALAVKMGYAKPDAA